MVRTIGVFVCTVPGGGLVITGKTVRTDKIDSKTIQRLDMSAMSQT
ncbi:MAG: hypothetical protein LBU65_07690 [Planctomycetaceae bacterium]|nr:hypothetical protein [Planctomycetaceae bacterium]